MFYLLKNQIEVTTFEELLDYKSQYYNDRYFLSHSIPRFYKKRRINLFNIMIYPFQYSFKCIQITHLILFFKK